MPAPFCEWYGLGGENEPLRMMHSAAALVRMQLPAAVDVEALHVGAAMPKALVIFTAFVSSSSIEFLPQLASRPSWIFHGLLQLPIVAQKAPQKPD